MYKLAGGLIVAYFDCGGVSMKVFNIASCVLAGVLLVAASGFSQQAPASNPTRQDNGAQMTQGQTSSMDDRMKACHADIHTLLKSGDDLKKTIAEARMSGDPGKVTEALDAAEKYFDALNARMNTCMSMMHEMSGAPPPDGQMQPMGQGSMMMHDGAKGVTQPSR
jgi:hypothetical protein